MLYKRDNFVASVVSSDRYTGLNKLIVQNMIASLKWEKGFWFVMNLGCTVLVWRPIWGGSNIELECNEPEPQPMACVLLLCSCSSELSIEDMEGPTWECWSCTEISSGSCKGQLFGSARKVLCWRWSWGSKEGNVCERLYLLSDKINYWC